MKGIELGPPLLLVLLHLFLARVLEVGGWYRLGKDGVQGQDLKFQLNRLLPRLSSDHQLPERADGSAWPGSPSHDLQVGMGMGASPEVYLEV